MTTKCHFRGGVDVGAPEEAVLASPACSKADGAAAAEQASSASEKYHGIPVDKGRPLYRL